MSEAGTPVWFISGCSTGFGRELAKLTLARGWPTVVTARDVAKVQDLVGSRDGRALALALDVTVPDQIAAAVAAAKQHFGGVDVLVNNAGYGYLTSVEEGEDAAIRAMFEANFFGLAALTRAVLPLMRARRRGHVVNISSVGGFLGNPGSGYYAATKHAVNGFSDALAKEVAPLGIKVLCVEPGPFRTDWAGRSLQRTGTRIPDYEATVGQRLEALSAYAGKQAGDPVRAGEAIIRAVLDPNTPHHLVLGAEGLRLVTDKLRRTLEEIETWRALGLEADFA
jgi:NAD(P)-dependent dehydrogenase (short-subunit alcohol dehydrogenase family)